MATITEDYVSYEVAKLLKEKGFPQKQENSGYYATEMVYCTTESKDGTHHFCHQYPACCDKKYEYICAPTLQMAMKWLREVHNIDISIIPLRSHKEYLPRIESDTISHDAIPCRKYEEACEAALKYSLGNLI